VDFYGSDITQLHLFHIASMWFPIMEPMDQYFFLVS
jgi:hypothetical protein